MLKFISILSLFILFQSDVIEEVSWSENYKLTWSDFKGAPNNQTDAVAITASGITFSYSIKKTSNKVHSFKTLVKAYFYPEHSWCKKEMVDDNILRHEQLHFDITELHARLFRQQIAKLKPSLDIDNQLDQLHQSINKQLSLMQNSYDEETNHSINTEAQIKWQESVAKQLKTLEKFKSKS
ncbi:DUF922 domain-containing protein [Mesoflavibacter sp.]|uniref:DUF922 domain-containing protein n=1 Tax=Mesoflavibacter sp. TaxID=1930902 RepID=UPI0035169A6C